MQPNQHTDLAKRIWPKIKKGKKNECWNWQGYSPSGSYGKVRFRNKTTTVHRVVYFLYYGELDDNLCIDHLCDNRLCCNPRHLEQVTISENSRRQRRKWVYCKRGHKFTDKTTYIDKKRGRRSCYICQRSVQKKYRAKMKALVDITGDSDE